MVQETGTNISIQCLHIVGTDHKWPKFRNRLENTQSSKSKAS